MHMRQVESLATRFSHSDNWMLDDIRTTFAVNKVGHEQINVRQSFEHADDEHDGKWSASKLLQYAEVAAEIVEDNSGNCLVGEVERLTCCKNICIDDGLMFM